MAVLKLSKSDIHRNNDDDKKLKLGKSQISYDSAMVSGWETKNKNALATLNQYDEKINGGGFMSADDLKSYRNAMDEYISTSTKIRRISGVLGGAHGEEEEREWSSAVNSLETGYDKMQKRFSKYKSQDEYDTAVRQNGWQQEYDGKSYDELSTILGDMEDGEKKEWLTGYAGYIDQQEKLSYDLDAGEKELAILKKERDEIKSLQEMLFDADHNPGKYTQREIASAGARYDKLIAKYGDYRGAEDAVNKQTEYMAEAKRAQSGEKLASVSDAKSKNYDPEFSLYSQFDSKVLDNSYDLGYEYLNADMTKRGDIRSKYITDANTGDVSGRTGQMWAEKFDFFDAMTNDEIAIYNYYYSKQGKGAAEKYRKSIELKVNTRVAEKMYSPMEDDRLMEYLFMLTAGPDQFNTGVQGLAHSIAGNEEYIAPSAIQIASGMVREDLKDFGPDLPEWMGGGSLGQAVYDFGVTTSNMAPSILASTAIGLFNPTAGAVVGNTLMGASAAGNAYMEKINLGYSKEQATAYGMMVGTSEALLQYALGGIGKLGGKGTKTILKNLDAVDNVLARVAQSAGGKILLNAGSEAFEEGLQSILEPYLWQAVSGGNASVDWQETLYSALMGFVTGGVFDGFETGTAAVGKAVDTFNQNTAFGRDIMDADGGVDALMMLADEMAGVSTGKAQKNLIRQIEKVSKKVDSGSKSGSTARKVAKLYDTVKTSGNMQSHADIVESLTSGENGLSTKEANAIVGALLARKNGMELTDKQSELLESVKDDPKVQRVLNEVINNEKSTVGQRHQQMRDLDKDIAIGMLTNQFAKTSAEKEFTPEGVYDVSDKGKAIRTDTNEEIDIKGVSAISEGNLTLELADGQTIDAKNVSFGNKNDALIYEAVARLGDNINAESANELISQYKGGNAEMFARGITQAYTYGFYGIDKSEMFSKYSLADKLTEAQRNLAYNLGKKYRPTKDLADKAKAHLKKAPAEKGVYYRDKDGKATDIETYLKESGANLKDVQKTAIEVMQKMSEMMGVRFNVYETWVEDGKHYYLDENGEVVEGNPNGFYDTATGEIYIDLNAGNDYEGTMLFTVAHELTHFMRQWSPEHFAKIAKIVFQHGGMKGSVSKLVALKQAKAKAKGKHLSYDTAMEEVVADGMETILKDGKVVEFMADVKQKDHAAWEKIKGWFKNLAKFLQKMVDAYKGQSAQTIEGAKVAEFSEDLLNQIKQIWGEGAVTAGENYKAAEVKEDNTENGGVKHQIRGDIVDVTGKEYDSVVELEYKVFNRVKRSGGAYIDFIRNNLIKKKITVLDGNGGLEVIEFAGPKERVWKDGANNDHAVIGELLSAKNDIKKLVILNAVETASISRVSGSNTKHSHQWLDENGWQERTSYVMTEKGIIYPVILKIARARDGRNILYDVHVNIEEGIAADKTATSLRAKKQAGQAVGTTMPSNRATIHQHKPKVKHESAEPATLKSERNTFAKTAVAHFGRTYSWKETGYLLTDGARLDFSGRHEGASGGYRTVDHRAILDIYPEDTDLDGNGAMVDFMRQGNIRIMPEGDGINLQVQPTKAQEQALDDFISRARGEVTLDIDDANGNTVVSVEYPRGTRATKVLQDIRNYFENGTEPVVSDVSRFRYSDRNSAKTRTFKNGQNAKGEFIANVLIDLADSNSEWWTGRYNRGILGMSKSDDTEFRQFYQEILKRTKEMDEYGESDLTVEDSFVVQDGKGRVYIYRVALDGYLHGVVIEKIDKAKYEAVLQRETKGGNHGKPNADIKRRARDVWNDLGRDRSGDGRTPNSDGATGYGRVDSGSPKSHKTGNDSRRESTYQEVPTVTDPDGALHQDRESNSVSNRTLLANALESVAQNDMERNRIAEYKEKIAQLDAQEKKLRELNAQIKELSFAKGPRDTKKIRELRDEAIMTTNRIGIYDKQLLRLEASAPLQKVLEREKSKAYKRAEQKGKEALEEYKAKAEAQQKETAEKWRESRKKAVEGRKKTAVREKVKNFKAKLERTLLQPTDRQYVPIGLIKAMVEVCEVIDTDTDLYKADGSINKAQQKRDETKEKLQNLKDEYEKLKTNSDPIYQGEFDEMVYTYLTELRDKFSGKSLKDMSLDDLTEMYEILVSIDETLSDARKLIGWGDAEDVYEAGDAIISEQRKITESRKNGKRNFFGKVNDSALNLSLSPVRNVERMSGYNGGSYLLKLFKKFEQGIRKKNFFVMNAYKSFEHLTSGKEYEDAIYKAVGKEYTDIKGRKFYVSKMQMMQAILSYERERANSKLHHIEKGGFTFANLDMLSKGKLNEAVSAEHSHRVPSATDMVAEFQDILKEDKWCQNYMAVAREFFDKTAKDAINETSIVLKHRIIAKDKSYIPFEVDTNFVNLEITDMNAVQKTINGYGMLSDTQNHAPQPLYITGLNNILDRHIEQVGNVYGLAIEVRNFNKVWNAKTADGLNKVNEMIETNWGKGGVKHIEQVVKDIQGPRVREKNLFTDVYDKVKSGYIGSTFLLNLSVVTKQIGSLYSAISMLRWRDPFSQMGNLIYTMANHKKISAEVDKYTATAWLRRQGVSDAELHTLMTEGKKSWWGRLWTKAPAIVNPTKWITAMDHAVALSLWRYAKIDTAKKTGLKGEELLKATAEFYDEVVENTQSMTDVLHRPEIQKQKNILAESFAMFKTDIYQMAGQLHVTASRFGANKTKENGMALGRTVYSIAMGAIWGQFMTTLFALLRYKVKPYRDEEDEELTAESWLKRQGFAFAGDIMGYILPILGSEVVGFFENIKYGESEDIADSLALTLINDLYDSMITIGTSINDREMPELADMRKLTAKALQVFGVPANNILRTWEAIELHAKDIANGEFFSFEAGTDRSAKHHIHRIVEAVDGGKTNVAIGLFEEALDELATKKAKGGEYGEDEMKDAKSDLKSALGQKYKDGEVTKVLVTRVLEELFEMDEDDIYWTFDRWDYAKENGSSDDYAKYSDFYTAVETGKNLNAIIKKYTDNGVSEETLRGRITSYFKPKYIEMTKAERADIEGYLINAYALLGYDRTKAAKDIRKWLEE